MKTSPQKILSVIGIGTVLSLLYSALNYATQIALVELFGYHLRGVYEILMSVLGLASVLFSFNLYTAINLHVSKNQGAPDNLGKLGSIVLAIQIAALIVLLSLAPSEDMVSGSHWFAFFVLLAGAAVLNHKVNEVTAILNGRHYFIEAKKLTLIGSVLSALAILLAYVLGMRDAKLIVWLAVIGPFLGAYVYGRFLFHRIADLGSKSGTLVWNTLYRENGAVYLISLAQFVSIKLYLLYIARNESVELLGVFSLSYSMVQFVMLPATFLATIIISNKTDSLGEFSRPFKVLMAYGIASGAALMLGVAMGLLDLLPLQSLRNPLFVDMLEVMALSIPFSVLNILVVATAIRKNMCSRAVVLGQALMMPLPIALYYLGTDVIGMQSAVSAAYVATWAIGSLATLAALQNNLRKSKDMGWPAFP